MKIVLDRTDPRYIVRVLAVRKDNVAKHCLALTRNKACSGNLGRSISKWFKECEIEDPTGSKSRKLSLDVIVIYDQWRRGQ